MAKGRLRIYLGAAPGVGKTYDMLDEGWRRRQRGTDVVIGFVETHDRPKTVAQIRDLEIVPRKRLRYRGRLLEEWTSTLSASVTPRRLWSTRWPTPTFPAAATRSAGRTSTSS